MSNLNPGLDRPPAYGEQTTRLDPTANPPRYGVHESHPTSPPPPPPPQVPPPTQSRFQERGYGQGADVIRHWQQERHDLESGNAWRRASFKASQQRAWDRIRTRKRALVIIFFVIALCIGIVAVERSIRERRNRDSS